MLEAKKRFVLNIFTNMAVVVVDVLIAISLTRYLIRTLTVEVYGSAIDDIRIAPA